MLDLNRMTEIYLEKVENLRSPCSPIGQQLDKLRLGLPSSGFNPSALEESRLVFATLSYLFQAVLNTEERQILFALKVPLSHEKDCAQFRRGTCDCDAVEYYDRRVRNSELQISIKPGEDPIQETRQGERFLRAAKDPQGEPMEDESMVYGIKAKTLTRQGLADLMGISLSKVKKVVARAAVKAYATTQYEALAAYQR